MGLKDGIEKVRAAFRDPDDANAPALNEILARAEIDASPEDRIRWLGSLLEWCLRRDGHSEGTAAGRIPTRFRYFQQSIERHPSMRAKTYEALYRVLRTHSLASFFADTGYSPEHGLWSDFARRVRSRFFPNERLSVDPRRILLRAVSREDSVPALRAIPDSLVADFLRYVVERNDDPADAARDLQIRLREEMREALVLLSASLAHYGLSSELRDRLPIVLGIPAVRGASFVSLAANLQSLAFAGEVATPPFDFPGLIARCRADIAHVYASLENTGVSVDLVYKLEILSAALVRSERVLGLLRPTADVNDLRDFLPEAAAAALRGQSIRAHLRQHFYLLSRSVAERNGVSGEHYVARSPAERRSLYWSACGGGAVVVLMTILKTYFVKIDLAPLFRATGIWIIYSGAFIAMQAMHLTLATKVPSFAANHLAKTLRRARDDGNTEAARAEWIEILRSQGLALAGNVSAAAVLATLVGYLFRAIGHEALMSVPYAEHTLQGLHPLFSPLLFQGALVGILLWISSLIGGWFENWVVYRDLPMAITHDARLRTLVGDARAARMGEGLRTQATGLATNVSLGFLLAFIPVFGSFFGLNLDGKHVTLMTASSIFGGVTLGHDMPLKLWAPAAVGLLLTAVLNFGVSFFLALSVAARAQRLRRAWVFGQLGWRRRRI